MDRYRILFFTSSLHTGGAENHILNLCRVLRSAGHEAAVCTISPAEEGLESALLDERVALFRLPAGSLGALPTPRVLMGLRRIVKSFRPQLVHAHLFHAEVFAAAASSFARAPLVVTRHSAGLEFRHWRRLVARIVGARVAVCIAVSEGAAEEAAGMGYPRSKIIVLPNAVDPQRFAPVDDPERGKRREALAAELFPRAPRGPFLLIGSAGGLKAVKNFRIMVLAAARLVKERKQSGAAPELRFAIFGEGPEEAMLAALIRDRGIESSFVLPGRRESLEDIYPLLDVFMLPSLSEGVPMALLEAMSSGVASVASEVGGVGGVLSGAGMLVSAGDESAFVEALKQLVGNEDIRRELGRKGRVRVLERFHIDIWSEKMFSIYQSALHRAPRPGADSRERPAAEN